MLVFLMSFFIYIIFSASIDKYYVGYSTNPWIRIEQHNTNTKDKFTGRTSDWELKAVFEVMNKSVAVRLERFIKKQKSRALIERLCQFDFLPDGILAQLVRVPHLRD